MFCGQLSTLKCLHPTSCLQCINLAHDLKVTNLKKAHKQGKYVLFFCVDQIAADSLHQLIVLSGLECGRRSAITMRLSTSFAQSSEP